MQRLRNFWKGAIDARAAFFTLEHDSVSYARAGLSTRERDLLILSLRSSGYHRLQNFWKCATGARAAPFTLERESVAYARAGFSTLERRVDYISP